MCVCGYVFLLYCMSTWHVFEDCVPMCLWIFVCMHVRLLVSIHMCECDSLLCAFLTVL